VKRTRIKTRIKEPKTLSKSKQNDPCVQVRNFLRLEKSNGISPHLKRSYAPHPPPPKKKERKETFHVFKAFWGGGNGGFSWSWAPSRKKYIYIFVLKIWTFFVGMFIEILVTKKPSFGKSLNPEPDPDQAPVHIAQEGSKSCHIFHQFHIQRIYIT
jgi:hypothetical protein